VLSSEIGFEFLPTLGGVPQCREEPRFESTDRMRPREEVPVEFLRIDLRAGSVR